MIEQREKREDRETRRKNNAWAKIQRNKDRLVSLGIPVDTLDPEERSEAWNEGKDLPAKSFTEKELQRGSCEMCGAKTAKPEYDLCPNCYRERKIR